MSGGRGGIERSDPFKRFQQFAGIEGARQVVIGAISYGTDRRTYVCLVRDEDQREAGTGAERQASVGNYRLEAPGYGLRESSGRLNGVPVTLEKIAQFIAVSGVRLNNKNVRHWNKML